jgi:hypothetical protein
MRTASVYYLLAISLALLGCSGGGGDGGTGPGPEPPTIVSGPSASGITARSVTVIWATDKDSDSKVRYGRTASYTDSVVAGQLVSNHSMGLSDLDPLTSYHYQVVSEDAQGLGVSSGDRTFVTLSPVQELVDAGWGFFENSDFDSALTRFVSAHSYEPGNVGVLEGLGWTYLRLYEFDQSRSSLEDALARDLDRVDCLAAVAFVYLALEEYEGAIEAAGDALAIGGGTYVFDHAPEITASDLRYCTVLSLVATGDLSGALAEAKLIDPGIELDPDDRETWGGHSSFEEALLVLTEDLKAQV